MFRALSAALLVAHARRRSVGDRDLGPAQCAPEAVPPLRGVRRGIRVPEEGKRVIAVVADKVRSQRAGTCLVLRVGPRDRVARGQDERQTLLTSSASTSSPTVPAGNDHAVDPGGQVRTPAVQDSAPGGGYVIHATNHATPRERAHQARPWQMSEFAHHASETGSVRGSRSGSAQFATGVWKHAEEGLQVALEIPKSSHAALHGQALASLAELRLAQGRVEEAERLITGFEDHTSRAPASRSAWTGNIGRPHNTRNPNSRTPVYRVSGCNRRWECGFIPNSRGCCMKSKVVQTQCYPTEPATSTEMSSAHRATCFDCLGTGVWRGLVQVPGLSLFTSAALDSWCGSHVACVIRVPLERERLKRHRMSGRCQATASVVGASLS
jgi:hypothetical protein